MVILLHMFEHCPKIGYFPNLVKWDLGTTGRTVEVVHVPTLNLVFYYDLRGVDK